MIRSMDHVSIVVSDLDSAKTFFGVLGFEIEHDSVIKGKTFADYMGVDGIEANHVTMVMPGSSPRFDVQLVHYQHPDAVADPEIHNLAKLGYNHVCYAVDDVEALVEKVRANGFKTRGDILTYHDRKLVFLEGPGGVTVELAEWQGDVNA